MFDQWRFAQKAEAEWWGDCRTTLVEDMKQIEFAPLMDLHPNQWMQIDLEGRNVVDLGGGPSSLLLKCQNLGPNCAVVDPCEYPYWTRIRYSEVGISLLKMPVEELPDDAGGYDEAWCYNVLQHVINPEEFIRVALRLAPVLRLMEWCYQPIDRWHPHSIRPTLLEQWLDQPGKVTELQTFLGHSGMAFHGVFRGRV
jgi:hypothetical protein